MILHNTPRFIISELIDYSFPFRVLFNLTRIERVEGIDYSKKPLIMPEVKGAKKDRRLATERNGKLVMRDSHKKAYRSGAQSVFK